MNQEVSSGFLATVWHLLGLVVAVLFFFSPALWVWFYQDDFIWLGLGVGFGQDWWTVFSTLIGGMYRPLTLQVFFGLGRQLFDLHPAMFHAVAILVHGLNTMLAYLILRRLVRHPAAAWAGAFFFGTHYTHLAAVFWLSAFNETALVFFQFLGLWAFLRYVEADDRRYYLLSLVALVLGILSKETIVTLPFLLGLYAVFAGCYRQLRHLWPHAVIALGYVGLRLAIGVFPAGPYQPEWGWAILTTLGKYFEHAFGIYDFHVAVPHVNELLVVVLSWVLAVLCLLYAALRFRATRWPVFGLAYFLGAIGPLLIYSHHFTDYYLAAPLLGLSVVVADFFDFWCARPRPEWLRWVLTAVIVFYVGGTALEFRRAGQWCIERGRSAHRLLQDARQAFRDLPTDCDAYIRGVGDEEYFNFIHDTGLRLAGFRGLVYLEPWRENIRNVHYFILTPERRAKIDCLAEVQFADGQFHVQKIVRNDARLPEGARAPD